MTGPPSRRVLITNLKLDARTGTEVVVRQLADALLRRGHRPVVYAPRLGPPAEEVRARGIPVVEDIRALAGPIDVIHAQHLPTAVAAIARFPDVPVVFVAHDFRAWHDTPPLFPSVRRYVGVDAAVEDRLRAEGVPEDRVRVVLNQPALDRYAPGPPLPERPRRALVFAKNRGHVRAIREACAAQGLPLDVVGAAEGRELDAPERHLPDYDVVFASALTAMEAMATGRGVIVCDGRGLAGWVGPAEFDAWRPGNFGLRLLGRQVTAESVFAELARYSPADAAAVAARVRADGGADRQAAEFERLYEEAIAERGTWRSDDAAWRTAMAGYVQAWSPALAAPDGWRRERALLIEERDVLLGGPAIAASGVTYALEQAEECGVVQPLDGFGTREPGGRWTCGRAARVALRVRGHCAATLHLRARPLVTGTHPAQRLVILAGDAELGAWPLDAAAAARAERGEATVVVHVPASRVPGHGVLHLQLRLPDAVSPQALGLNDDSRELGVFLHDVRIEQATDA